MKRTVNNAARFKQETTFGSKERKNKTGIGAPFHRWINIWQVQGWGLMLNLQCLTEIKVKSEGKGDCAFPCFLLWGGPHDMAVDFPLICCPQFVSSVVEVCIFFYFQRQHYATVSEITQARLFEVT